MAYGCTITVNSSQIPSSQSNFVWLATEANFPTAAIDGGASSILNGGGNLRCYTDSAKITRLPIEVVTFVTGVSPQVQVWGLSPTLADSSTVYIEADSVAISQPSVTDTYGRNAVWVDYEAVIHANETGTNGVFVDSTGNGHDTTLTTGASLPTSTINHPFGETWPDFNQTQEITLANSYSLINNSAFTMSAWIGSDITSNNTGVFGSRHNSPDTHWAQIQAGGRVFTKASSVENFADSANQTIGLRKLKQNNVSLDNIYNGLLDSTDTTITSGEAINNTTVSNNFRVGTYYDNGASRRFNGRAAEFRVKRSKDTSSFDTAEYNNQSAPNLFWSTSAWVDSGGGSILITIDSLSQSQALEQITVTPTYSSTTVTVDNASQQQSISQINLTQLNKLVINNLSHQQTVEQSLLTQHNNIAINGLSNTQTIDSVSLTQVYILTINDLSQSQATEQVTTTTLGVVDVDNVNQQQTVEQTSLTQLGIVGLDNVNQQQTLEQILLTEHSILTLDNLSQQQTVDPTVLTYAAKVLLNSLSQSQTAQDINLSTINIVTIDNLSNQQMIDSINFGGVIVGYLAGELSVVYAYNGDIMIQNALTGDVSILTN